MSPHDPPGQDAAVEGAAGPWRMIRRSDAGKVGLGTEPVAGARRGAPSP